MSTPTVALLLQADGQNTIHDQPRVPTSTSSHIFIVLAILLLIAGFAMAVRLVLRSMMGKPRDHKRI